jgi:hypothetical protein
MKVSRLVMQKPSCREERVDTDPVLDVVRRELRRMSPDVRMDTEQIRAVLVQEVLKRDVIEGDKADEARKKITRAANKALKAKAAAAGASKSSSADESGHSSNS